MNNRPISYSNIPWLRQYPILIVDVDYMNGASNGFRLGKEFLIELIDLGIFVKAPNDRAFLSRSTGNHVHGGWVRGLIINTANWSRDYVIIIHQLAFDNWISKIDVYFYTRLYLLTNGNVHSLPLTLSRCFNQSFIAKQLIALCNIHFSYMCGWNSSHWQKSAIYFHFGWQAGVPSKIFTQFMGFVFDRGLSVLSGKLYLRNSFGDKNRHKGDLVFLFLLIYCKD